ncbi:MAG: M48 family metalloprotease [Akkermansiaceae bacterium]|nr:M48 family metalloprotease [Armatimonadota bacterium]
MMPADASWRLLSLLWQASWQGALFVAAVGLMCLVLRVPAPYRALLWFLAGVKFLGGFLWLLVFGHGVPVSVSLPASLLPVSRAAVMNENPAVLLNVSLCLLWATGALLCGVLVVIRARSTYHALSRSEPHTGATISGILSDLSWRIGISPGQVPAVCVATEEAHGPQVTLMGSKCVVVLPATLVPPSATALNENDLRFVIAHELAHIRRGDLWAGLLFTAVQVLFFFHPCAVWAKREWEAAREESCDLSALRVCAQGGRDSTAQYGALLLRLGSGATVDSVGSARIAASPFAALRRRLTHLNRHQTQDRGRFSRASLLFALLLLAALIVPLEFRWITSSIESIPRAVTSRPVNPKKSTPAVAVISPTVSRTFSRKATIVASSPRVNTNRPRALTMASTRQRVRVTVSKPTLPRVFAATLAKPVVSAKAMSAPPILSEPLLVADDTRSGPAESVLVPAPVPVVPDASPDVANAPLLQTATDGFAGSGAVSTSRPYDALNARTSAPSPDVKTASRTGYAVPTSENSAPLSGTIPSTLPSPAPASSESTPRELDFPRPPQQ